MNQAVIDGYTPLYVAAESGNDNAVERLLEAGADVNQALKALRTYKSYKIFP